MPEEDKLEDVVEEEQKRGTRRRPVDTKERERRHRLRRAFLDLLRSNPTEEEFFSAIGDELGLTSDSDAFEKIREAWRAYARQKSS